MRRWHWSPSFVGLIYFLAWVVAGTVVVAVPWSIIRLIHLRISRIFCEHVFWLWKDPHPELTMMLIGLGEGAILGGLLCLGLAIIHRGAPRPRRRAMVLIRATVARQICGSLMVGALLSVTAVLFPAPYELLTGLPAGMGIRDDASWAFNVGTAWGWLMGAVTCGISAWRNPAWRRSNE